MTEPVLTLLTLAAGGLAGWSIRGALAERVETRLYERMSKRSLDSLARLVASVGTILARTGAARDAAWLEWLQSADAADVIAEHPRVSVGLCGCGWGVDGQSHARHVLTLLAESRHVKARER